jgi:HEAT repeat protein
MLTDEKLSDLARYALERIPGGAADKALIEALGEAKGNAQIGIVNTLGERRCRGAASDIAKLTSSSDQSLAGAAISALGKIGGPDAAAALGKAKGSVPDKLKMVAYDACLKCADQMVAEGKSADARKMYQSLYTTPGVPQLVRAAALRGMLNAASSGSK